MKYCITAPRRFADEQAIYDCLVKLKPDDLVLFNKARLSDAEDVAMAMCERLEIKFEIVPKAIYEADQEIYLEEST